MSKNKPTPKKVTSKAKKPNGRKTWLKVAKKVHELNKKKKLGWTWSESMKFASKKVYPNFKGKVASKVKITDIESEFKKGLLEEVQPMPTPTPKLKQICDDVRQIPDAFLVDLNDWYLIAEDSIWNIFTANMPMRFAFDGIIDTGIIPKYQMPDMKDIREQMRKLYGNVSDPMPQFTFKRLVQPNKKDDDDPCSYYILVTMVEDSYDSEDDKEISSDTELTEEQKLAIEQAKQKDKKSRKKAKARKRPTEVEPKSITKAKGESEKKSEKSEIDKEIQLEKLKVKKSTNLTEALKILRKNYDDGLMTKREFREANKKLLDRFEKGGQL
jgi:hypothetical protein